MKRKTERELNKNFLLKNGDYRSTKEVFERINEYIPDSNIFAELDSKNNIIYHTARELYTTINSLGDGLISLGLENKHIAIIAENSYRYFVCDSAISGGVGIVTPVDKDAPKELLITLLNKIDCDAVIISAYLLDKVKEINNSVYTLKTIITIDEKVEGYYFYDEIIDIGSKINPSVYASKVLDLEAPCKLLFTSGTTGANKAVVLNQNNLAQNIINCLDLMMAPLKSEKNTSMSILPMHHATEINTHIMSRVASGRLTYINDSMINMMRNIKIFKPTCITVVPMVANMFYRTIWNNAKKQGLEDKLKKGIKLCRIVKKLTGKDITHKLFKDIYENFGGNLNQIVVGGAMLSPETCKGLSDIGIFVVNGYGITECGPLISMNTDTVKDTYSVGKLPPSLQYKVVNVDEDGYGELCIKGKSVSKGYYKDVEATKEVFDLDGYFHTGDMVKVIDNIINMSGRKKNVIVLENGKNVCPEEIENEVYEHLPFVKDIVVYDIKGKNNQQLLVCGLYIDDKNYKDNKELIKEKIKEVNAKLPNYKRIAYVNLADSEYEKTSTRKIKRTIIMNKHNPNTGISIS